jgi:hypothetical protein
MGVRLVTTGLIVAVFAMGCGSERDSDAENDSAVRISDDSDTTDQASAVEEDSGFSFNARSDEGSVSINANGNTFEIKSDSGASMQIGGTAELPDNMPDDVPTYPNMKLLGVTNSPTDAAIMYQAQIENSVKDVAEYFSEQAESEDWVEQVNMNQGAQMAMRQYTKDNRVLNIVVNGSDGGSVVTVTTAEE